MGVSQNNLKFELAKKYLFGRFENELAPNLFYHGIHHTRDDVLPAAIKLANLEGVKGNDLLRLKTGALYHDSGYMYLYPRNEIVGVLLAWYSLPIFGFFNDDLNSIEEIIMATEIKLFGGKKIQMPDSNNILQKIMCDADLDYLGRDDFLEISENYRLELMEYGERYTLKKWKDNNLLFLKNHRYFTESARDLREINKEK
ncbi:MAG: HD domain-containing protein, partial [Nanoarchaeota archaeon]|nr:HD domain-containing protein [Nanoarchaeota archaeon]